MLSKWIIRCSSDAGGAYFTNSDNAPHDAEILMWVVIALVIILIGIIIAFCCVMYLKHAPNDEPETKTNDITPNKETTQKNTNQNLNFNTLSEEEQKLILQHRLETLEQSDRRNDEQ